MTKRLRFVWLSVSGRGDARASEAERVERLDRHSGRRPRILRTRRGSTSTHPALTTLLASTVVLAACAGPSSGVEPEGEPYIRGPIESISHGATESRILVRAGPGSRDPCGIAATVDAATRYLGRGSDGAFTATSIAELRAGDTVAVYVDGPVAESCPLQGRASAIVLVGGSAP